MLTVVVVHKHDMQPGEGFFKLAKQLGRNTSCRVTFWAKELAKVYKRWKQRAAGCPFWSNPYVAIRDWFMMDHIRSPPRAIISTAT